MLDTQTIAIIKSTLPLLQQYGPGLTAHFYQRMFHHHPELKPLFNMSHQRSGDQREALFNAICAYTAHIDTPAALAGAVERIAHRHVSVGIQPQQYAIVGHHLLKTLEELFNPGSDVLNAWGKAYDALAQLFIAREARLYQGHVGQPGGWAHQRAFTIAEKRAESDLITSFTLVPQDGAPIASFLPGQYLGVYVRHPSLPRQAIRQYSLTHAPNGQHYRIAVKREPQGAVSRYLHDVAGAGDTLHLSAPCGGFTLETTPETPLALISAGVGVTPLLSMLDTLSRRGQRAPLYWLHAADSDPVRAFGEESERLLATVPLHHAHLWLRRGEPAQPVHARWHRGTMDLGAVGDGLRDPRMQFYFCGPIGFMQHVARQLLAQGVDAERLHYECFGPHKIL
ncbi:MULTISPECIES: NO-inducible flavohemoprotein [Edwardsiella]|uniref:Flavohemoprotein n=2 Tax=Edwardsiella anguillarum TaxID=1821960 RepID=A0A076LLA4_9GAMM|nr:MULTISPECIES: NO-inducible flavohemoprotein [Edwardsiella]AIJ07507.1 Flavohemoprotein (Hemoglobin-like protein) (Flavohemoglobin) (Nitric oxide dioxygenase) [Edwardsiella anguillarum ET080813]AKR78719.2 NO-inducible flavohemoprotein [Edwardsiella sp. LADL05-105]KAB0589030.1 NO-inducible flavohemoprotein [Edwardsiella anguillarum]UOU78583.1 NO-inducible flavohemoprotein [Edwardsiella anguillarum]WHP79688.1 NO-inducible flavohemoprotein [Edwardsiella anguillarum]